MKNYCLLLLAVALFSCCRRDVASEFVNDISCYSDYSTVDWPELSGNCCRFGTANQDSITYERILCGFPMEIALELRHLLQNARADFHQKSLPLRASAAREAIDVLDRAEAAFDTVFVRCISQEYYMRLFPEMYNETMKPAIDGLVMQLQAKAGR